MTKALLALAVLGWSFAGTSPSAAQVKWQMTTEYPENNISGAGLVTFGRLVAQQTNGFVTTDNVFDNRLKLTSADMLDAAQRGRIAGGDAFAGPLEERQAIFGLPSLPFLAQSVEAAKAVNARARGLYEAALAAKGLKLLYITIWPATGLWSEHPVEKVEDLKTLAVRTYDGNSAEVMRAAGSTAEQLPFNEAIAKIKDHKLNAILSSGDGGAGRKLWDYLRYFTAISYAVPISVAFVQVDAFTALPPEVRSQVEAAAAETERLQIAGLSDRIADNYKRMRDNGVVIVDPAPPEIVAALKAAARGTVDAWKVKAGSEAAAIADASIRQ